LDEVEKRVEILIKGEDGTIKAKPFPPSINSGQAPSVNSRKVPSEEEE
jgi:hypothetical protein